MNFDKPVTRRESIKKLVKLWGGLSLAGAFTASVTAPVRAQTASADKKFLIEGIGQTDGYSVTELTRKVFERAGGVGRFISKGDVVVIKPNLSWARRPEMAATTNPEVLKAVVELCQEAGAKKVRIADNTINDARRCFALSGAGAIARSTGADLIHPRSSLMKNMNLKGRSLDTWPVFVPLVEADAVINLPVAKHHSLSSLTVGMKNWIGGVGGSRWSLHQDIHQSIVDLATFFQPTVTLIDAIRIMTRNGPSGGSTSYVTAKNTLILSNDPVAGDAQAALLFGRSPEKLGFIRLARDQGLGTSDFQTLAQQRVVL
ncbi:MAG: DUF362 domain-containing protein [Deltaproteobacteria bacterium]|jgi:uncharacterized protein (DUF362 family)|nr:DUF362 domain-containing protein [Deltaproteobacteria bacterium]MBW2482514.1 DUF362 domain-containing protein [Deltaproteobacteria bacterium]